MFTEILIYIALFAALFSGTFTAAFQTVDAVRYLQVQKNTIDDLYFFSARLDQIMASGSNWETVSLSTIIQSIQNSGLLIESFSSQIFETATSSSRVLFLTLEINKKMHTFSYVQRK